MSRLAAAILAAAAFSGAGCHNCAQEAQIIESMAVAEMNYRAKKFDTAAMIYTNILNRCPDHYDAIVGLANAFREHGNDLFRAAEQQYASKRVDDAQKSVTKANELHRDSSKFLTAALDQKPDDLQPHYYLGLLSYQRATSPMPFPYPVTDTRNRQRERDYAIEKFKLVTSKVSQLYEAHRYLGVLLFAAGRSEEAIDHFHRYHESRQTLYNVILGRAATTEVEKKQKMDQLASVEREIEDARQVLTLHLEDLIRRHDPLAGKEASKRSPEEKARMAALEREMLALENVIRRFQLVAVDPDQNELRQRCRDYITAFNRGLAADVLAYVSAREGEQAAVERSIMARLEAGTRYDRVVFRSIALPDSATGAVGFDCEIRTKKGEVQANAQVTVRWRKVEGRWMVAEHP